MTVGALSDHVEGLVLDGLFRGGTPGKVSNLRLVLYSADPGEAKSNTVNNLTQVSPTETTKPVSPAISFGNPSSGVVTNDQEVTVTLPAGGNVTHIAVIGDILTDLAVILFRAQLTDVNGNAQPVVVPELGTFRLPIGKLTLRVDDGTASAMALFDWVENLVMNWLVNEADFPVIAASSVKCALMTNAATEPSILMSEVSSYRQDGADSNLSFTRAANSSTIKNGNAATFGSIASSITIAHALVWTDKYINPANGLFQERVLAQGPLVSAITTSTGYALSIPPDALTLSMD